jgi:dGTPase
MRAGMIKATDLPEGVATLLGTKPSLMITIMVADLIYSSTNQPEITMSAPVQIAMDEFRAFMFERIYHSPHLEPDRQKAKYVIHKLFEYFLGHPQALPQEFLERESRWGLETTVVDYIAGLSDSYAIKLFEDLFIPSRVI